MPDVIEVSVVEITTPICTTKKVVVSFANGAVRIMFSTDEGYADRFAEKFVTLVRTYTKEHIERTDD